MSVNLKKWFKNVKSIECKGSVQKIKPIYSWVDDDKKVWERSKEWSTDESFIRFVLELLRRGQGDVYINEDKIATELKINDIPSVDHKELYNEFNDKLKGVKKREDIFNELDQNANLLIKNNLSQIKEIFKYTIGYRWGGWTASYVIIGARSMIKPENGGFEKYIKIAQENSEVNDFCDDKLLQLKFVGLKVRDLALTQFLDEYIAIDVNIKNVLIQTGLIRYYNQQFNENIPEDPKLNRNKQYLAVWKMLKRICKIVHVTPRELDRVLWHLGGKYEDKNFTKFKIKT